MGYITMITKQKRRKKVDPLKTKLAIERDIQEVLRIKQEQSGNEFTLVEVLPKSFIYEVTKDDVKKRFSVPYTASDRGGLVLDFAEQREMQGIQTNKSNEEDQSMRIFKATPGSEEEYKRIIHIQKTGGQQTNTEEILFPTGVIQFNKQEDEKKWKEEAEKTDILLPTEFNRSSSTQQAENEEEILMPCGY